MMHILMEALYSDIRHEGRLLVRAAGFTAVALAVLALTSARTPRSFR